MTPLFLMLVFLLLLLGLLVLLRSLRDGRRARLREECARALRELIVGARVDHRDVAIVVYPAWRVYVRTEAGRGLSAFVADAGSAPLELVADRAIARLCLDRGEPADGPPSSRGAALRRQLAAVGRADAEAAAGLEGLVSRAEGISQ